MHPKTINQAILAVAMLFILLAMASSCTKRSDPEVTLSQYVTAIRERRCPDALAFLSERTRSAIEKFRTKPKRPETPADVDEYYCSEFAFEDCKLSKMELKAMSGDKATVTMPCGRTQDGIFPGFTSPFLKYEPRDVELVYESGEWRVTEPVVLRYLELREEEDLWRQQAIEYQQRYNREYFERKKAAEALRP